MLEAGGGERRKRKTKSETYLMLTLKCCSTGAKPEVDRCIVVNIKCVKLPAKCSDFLFISFLFTLSEKWAYMEFYRRYDWCFYCMKANCFYRIQANECLLPLVGRPVGCYSYRLIFGQELSTSVCARRKCTWGG